MKSVCSSPRTPSLPASTLFLRAWLRGRRFGLCRLFFRDPYDLRIFDKGHVLGQGKFDHVFFVDEEADLVDFFLERGQQLALRRIHGQQKDVVLFLLCHDGPFDHGRFPHYPGREIGRHVAGEKNRSQDPQYQSEDERYHARRFIVHEKASSSSSMKYELRIMKMRLLTS